MTIEQLIENSREEAFSTTIDLKDIQLAKRIIHRKPRNTKDLFVILCAMNLINAALKKKEFKKVVHYGMVKPKVSRLLILLLNSEQNDFDIQFYINQSENCAYIEIYDLQFSFHNIQIDEQLKEFIDSDRNNPKPWREVRLQKVAGELFNYGLRKV